MAAKVVVGALIAIGVVVLACAVWLWPSQQKVNIPLPFQNAAGGAVTTEAGHVLSSKAAPCGSPSAGGGLTPEPKQAPDTRAPCGQTLGGIHSRPHKGANTAPEVSGGARAPPPPPPAHNPP